MLAAAALLIAGGLTAYSEEQKKPGALVPLPVIVPAPQDNPTTPAKVALGRQLFFDPRLSGENRMSCATCHLPEKSFGDGLGRGQGNGGKVLTRNTPTVLNVGFYERYSGMDGRRASKSKPLVPQGGRAMTTCDLDMSVPDWVIEHPETLAMFRELGVDSSCGGKSLAYACHQQGLNPEAVLARLFRCVDDKQRP